MHNTQEKLRVSLLIRLLKKYKLQQKSTEIIHSLYRFLQKIPINYWEQVVPDYFQFNEDIYL